nr:GntR family transcriptional regulator [Arthrobacter sp. SDTb3-6]
MREDILTRTTPPDESLTEMALTQRYAASRTPVREALQRLEQDGLVERRGKVLTVRSHTAEEIVDMYESRIILEQAAAAKAARKRTTPSSSLVGLPEGLDQQVRRYPLTTLTYPGRWETVLTHYEALIQAIESEDTTTAGAIAAAHMSESLNIRLQMYASNPGVL